MRTETIQVPTATLEKVLGGGLRSLTDEELEGLARYVKVPETDGDPVWPLGIGGYVMHLATRQEAQVRRGERVGNVATCFAALAAPWMLLDERTVA